MEALQNQYIGYHSQNITDESKEKGLERISKEFLSTVEPGDRFAQGVDFYEDIVRISQYFDEHEDFYKMVKAGINSLEKYGLNLWKFPWRKEYHTVKLYTAYFKCNIEKQLKDKDFILSVLEFLGYTERDEQKVSLKDSERRNAMRASFYLYLLQVELQLIEEIQSQISTRNIPLEKIVKVRSKKRTVEEAIHYLDIKIANKRRKLELSKAISSGAADAINRSNEPTVGNRYIPVAELPHYKVPPGGVDSGQVTDNVLYGLSPKGTQTEHADTYNCDARNQRLLDSRNHGRYDDARMSVAGREKTSDSQHATKPLTGSPLYSANAKGGHQHYVDSRCSTYPRSGCDDARMTVTRREKTTDSQYATKPSTGSPLYSAYTKEGQQHGADSRYRTFPLPGSPYTPGNTKGRIEESKMQLALHSNGYSFRSSEGAGAIAHGTNTRYVNLRGTNGSYSQNITSSGLDKSLLTRQGGRPIHQTSSSHSAQGFTGMENERHARSTCHLSGNNEPSYASKAAQASQQNRNMSSEDKRQPENVRHIPGADEAAKSMQASPVASGNTAVYNISSGATEGKSHLSEKPLSHVVSRTTRNSTQKEDFQPVQIPNRGSVKEFQTGAVSTTQTTSYEARAANKANKVENSICVLCRLEASCICRSCFRCVCEKCKETYSAALCEETNGGHQFVKLKVPKGKCEQSLKISREEWSCVRCTFFNPAEKKICQMCATTRGLGAVELSKPGSRVCGACTYHNNENARYCCACLYNLDLNCPETAC